MWFEKWIVLCHKTWYNVGFGDRHPKATGIMKTRKSPMSIEDKSFYDGQSSNPVHKALGLRLATIKLAQMSVHRDFDSVVGTSFTKEEESTFARLQIRANVYLQSIGRPPLPLLHLSPRMLLPYKPDAPFAIADISQEVDKIEQPAKGATIKAEKKKKKKRPKQVTASAFESTRCPVMDNCPESETLKESTVVEEQLAGSEERSSESRKPWHSLSLSQECIREIVANAVDGSVSPEKDRIVDALWKTCMIYEDQLLSLREKYEDAVQAVNLRLFITNTEADKLREDLRVLQPLKNSARQLGVS